jgi:hypothetical protein
MSIELTNEQRQALQSEVGKPVDVVDPATRQHYVLIAREQYEHVRSLLEGSEPHQMQQTACEVPAGILRSQQAFWRDLPELLKDKLNRGRWVCYHGDERVGIARTKTELIRECLRRGYNDDEYDFDVIEPHTLAPWEAEEIDAGGHEGGEMELDDLTDTSDKAI